MTPLGGFEANRNGSVCIISLTGELDSSNAATLEEKILQEIPNEATGVVLHLDDLTYLDSAGVRLLFGLDQSCRSRQQRTTISLTPEHLVRRILTVAHVDAVIPVCDSVDAATAAIREAM